MYYKPAEVDGFLRALALRCAGVAAMVASIGLWIVPGIDGDAAMQLSKLLVSAILLVGGAAMIGVSRRSDAPEVVIDTKNRHLTVITRDRRGHVTSQTSHAIDDLREIELRDGLLTARDKMGEPLIALPVEDAEVEGALRSLLSRPAV
ncbi:hypothetical protein DD563_05930 [Pelagicola sp. LXJ1103]|nr:hypothetical protein DD563_05930 [Pelagicola sp. LXJ1103]